MRKKLGIKQPTGMVGFTIVWAGQLVSVLASSMTQFALTIWAYQETGSAGCPGIDANSIYRPFPASLTIRRCLGGPT